MKKIKAYIAISLNGKIAAKDGSVHWLESIPNPDKLDYGYFDFYDTIDTTIMGNSTYQQVIGWDIPFPYPTKKNYILTRNKALQNTEYVEFINENQIDFITDLKQQDGNDIWLIGGGQINTMLLNAGLVDELIIHIMPIIIDGIELFGGIPKETALTLIETKSYPTGVVEMKYKIG